MPETPCVVHVLPEWFEDRESNAVVRLDFSYTNGSETGDIEAVFTLVPRANPIRNQMGIVALGPRSPIYANSDVRFYCKSLFLQRTGAKRFFLLTIARQNHFYWTKF